MFINTGEGKRGRGEATATSIFHLDCLPRIVITQIHPTTINTNSSPAAKRKLGGPVASIRLLAESRKVASEILDTFWTEGKGESSRFCLEHLPSLVLCHLMQFLPHSALLNLSMTSSCLHSLVMREWKNNPSIWRHITLSPSLSPSRLASLKKTLVGKKRFIRSIRIADGNDFLSDSMCDFICGFYRLRRIVVQPKIKHRHIIRILSAFTRLQFVELTKLGTEGTLCTTATNTSN